MVYELYIKKDVKNTEDYNGNELYWNNTDNFILGYRRWQGPETEAGTGGKEGSTGEDLLIKFKGGGKASQWLPQVASLKMVNYIHLDCEDRWNCAPCIYICHLYIVTYIHTANTVFSTWICSHELPSIARCQLTLCTNLCVYRDTF